jgi:hypothetical protein
MNVVCVLAVLCREVYGSVACSVGALVATAITLLVVLDAKEIAMLYASSPAAQL